jgi:hypothetical protein
MGKLGEPVSFKGKLGTGQGYQDALSRDLAGRVSLPALSPAQLGTWNPATLLPFEKNSVSGQRRLAVPMFIQDAISGVMAPGKALRGEYGLTATPGGRVSYDGMAEDAAALAGTVGLASAPLPKPVNALGMFGGVMAKTADKAALETAQKMAEKGASKQEIWDATGWFKGADDKWRFEIPDNQSVVNTNAAGLGPELQTGPMSRAMEHDRLYNAYPELADMPAGMRLRAGGVDGTYAPPRTVGNRLIEGVSVEAPTKAALRSGMLHEGQHAIQTREGFAVGANPDGYGGGYTRDELFSAAKAAYEDAAAVSDDELLAELLDLPKPAKSSVPKKPWEELTERQKLEWLDMGRQRMYRMSAGEVEARNVQYRANLTPEQRRAKAPWLTQDTPDERQIVRF